jgi:hypothetical protein
MHADPKLLLRRAGAAVELVPHLLIKPDPDLLPLGNLGERRALRMPEYETA